MSTRIDLVPIEAEELLLGIQRHIDAGLSRSSGAVQFFYPLAVDSPQEYAVETFSQEGFPEQAYLLANPDVADAVQRGEFDSGFQHWNAIGKTERRSFEHTGFNELEPNRRNSETPRSPSLDYLKRLCREMQAHVAQMGAVPPSPGTFRGAVGRQAILLLRRLLWWHTRSVSSWADATTKAFKEQHKALEYLGAAEEQSRRTLVSMQDLVERITAEVQEAAKREESLVSRVQQLESKAGSAEELNRALVSQLHRLEDRANALEQKMKGTEAHQSEQFHAFQEALAARESVARRVAEVTGPNPIMPHSDYTSDALYLAFEDAFRGPREEIKRRQSVYLPFLNEAQAGTAELPVLDLGCGRGEWLELLRDLHMAARGRDANFAMVAYCRALNLEVEQGDALASLLRLPDSSLGAVTCFHMIEHIPFDSVLSLLRESMRVLKPGGLLMLETPNPKNLTVASYTFYLDPSHLKPLPSEMLRFFVEAAGFSHCQVLELQPAQAPDHDGLNIPEPLNKLLYGPRDYGLIARRPA